MNATQQADGSGKMFDAIAHRYDLLNRVLSLGLDQGWRRKLVAAATRDGAQRILDLATGTADVAIALAETSPSVEVTGVDPSEKMLDVGRDKCAQRGFDGRVQLQVGDGCRMQLGDDEFDAATIAFGIRNVPDRPACLRELCRVVRPNGVVAILELAEPGDGPLAAGARVHVRHVVPRLGALLSGAAEYRYLQTSVAAFPDAAVFMDMMREAGLREVTGERLSFGAAWLYVGRV